MGPSRRRCRPFFPGIYPRRGSAPSDIPGIYSRKRFRHPWREPLHRRGSAPSSPGCASAGLSAGGAGPTWGRGGDGGDGKEEGAHRDALPGLRGGDIPRRRERVDRPVPVLRDAGAQMDVQQVRIRLDAPPPPRPGEGVPHVLQPLLVQGEDEGGLRGEGRHGPLPRPRRKER